MADVRRAGAGGTICGGGGGVDQPPSPLRARGGTRGAGRVRYRENHVFIGVYGIDTGEG